MKVGADPLRVPEETIMLLGEPTEPDLQAKHNVSAHVVYCQVCGLVLGVLGI